VTKDPSARVAGVLRRITNQYGDLWIAVILVGLMGFFAIVTPAGTFLSLDNFRDIALNTSEIVLLAAGQTFILIAAGIDLSVGSITIFCAVISAKLLGFFSGPVADNYPDVGVGLAVALPLTLAVGCAWGFINGWITVKWHVPPFIVTLGTLGITLGLAQIISGGLNLAVPSQLQERFTQGGLFDFVPWPVVLASGVVAILWAVLARTRFGLRVYALGANMEALRRAGVNVGRLTVMLYILMGFLCAIVALMDVARFSSASLAAHTQDNLNAIAAAVIGGTSLFGGRGRMGGTVIGAFIPAVLRNGFILMAVQPYWQNVVVGTVLILAVYIDQVRRGGFVVWRRA
jgi:ribose transport system permease protein